MKSFHINDSDQMFFIIFALLLIHPAQKRKKKSFFSGTQDLVRQKETKIDHT